MPVYYQLNNSHVLNGDNLFAENTLVKSFFTHNKNSDLLNIFKLFVGEK